jgi:hypothetical protein
VLGVVGQVEELRGKVLVLIGEWQLALNEDSLERPMMEEVLGCLQVSSIMGRWL